MCLQSPLVIEKLMSSDTLSWYPVGRFWDRIRSRLNVFAKRRTTKQFKSSVLKDELKKAEVLLEREKQMTKQVLQRKQDVEWQLMEFMSQVENYTLLIHFLSIAIADWAGQHDSTY